MNCKNCGKELADGMEMCRECEELEGREEDITGTETKTEDKSETKGAVDFRNNNYQEISFVCIVMGILSWCYGFYKFLCYRRESTIQYDAMNAYVGSDAYNYIINGNYFIAFSVIGSTLLIIGVLLRLYTNLAKGGFFDIKKS